MKMRMLYLTLLIMLGLLSGCHHDFEAYVAPEEKQTEAVAFSEDELVIWTTEDILTENLAFFFKRHPTIRFKIKEINRIEVIDRYYNALTLEEVPDLLLLPDEYVGLLSELDQFEDLSRPPYFDAAFYSSYPDALFDRYTNMNGEMYAFPVHFFPFVTYYRHDIFEAMGFPSQPEAMSDYISDAKRYLAMVTQMNEAGYDVYQSNQTLIQDGLRVSYPFDASYQYIYDDAPFQQLLNTVASLEEREINPNHSIWNAYGQEKLKQSELVMFQMPSYGVNHLKTWVPEQTGLWRMAKMPFGLSGIDREQSMMALIPKRANHQTLSFDLVRALTRSLNYEIFSIGNVDMLDQSHLDDFYYEVLSESAQGKPSMLDLYARRHWFNTMFDVNKGLVITPLLFQKTHDRLLEEIRLDQRLLMKEKARQAQLNRPPLAEESEPENDLESVDDD